MYNQIDNVNFSMHQYRSYAAPECRTVHVTVIQPYRHAFKLSVPFYEDVDVAIIKYIKAYKTRRCVQIRSVEYNYSIG